MLADAAKKLGKTTIALGGFELDGGTLSAIAKTPASEPILRAVREGLHRPIDLEDFLLFLDDVIRAKRRIGDRKVVVTSDRARRHGILIHPYDVFRPGRAKRYAAKRRRLPIDEPPAQEGLEPAEDGAPPHPRWTARFQQPATKEGRIAELETVNPRFGARIRALVTLLDRQGATTVIESAVRSRKRGYLIFGSYYLSRAKTRRQLRARLKRLERYNRSWGLNVPIAWRHPGGFRATVEAARKMADTYGVDYATVGGARRSDHYDGKAVDLVAVDLPRTLRLTAPDGAEATFDLSAPEQPRDLSLSPELIDWIEAHFGIDKLRSDYPHWSVD